MNQRIGFDAFAQPITPHGKWGDIPLPPSSLALLRRIASRLASRAPANAPRRGTGLALVGEGKTDKQKAAAVLANELGRPLYRVDLAKVTSKYIGETEKNLRGIFSAAADRNAILYFDEADALFGRRSEVKDSHDRYANIEAGFLLQRMEEYGGLSILAFSRAPSLSARRRFRLVVNF